MPTPKPPYPAAFRQQMVELVRAGRGVTGLAREFGCMTLPAKAVSLAE